MQPFRDRHDAGIRLATRLEHLARDEPVVVGLPRGGVPVAFEVAKALGAPLDVIVVRKIGVPFQPELGMGAVGEGGVCVLNEDVVRLARVSPDELAGVEARERAEVERRAALYRRGRPMLPLEGETVIVVDDGVATGGTARAALEVARAHGARRVVLAVPVGAPDTLAEMTRYADEVVAVATPTPFNAVGQWYRQFAQTPDGEVVALLATASSAPRVQATGDPPHTGSTARDDTVEIPIDGIRLTGQLTLPADPVGLVIFAHGSGSSRHSPRNQFVARQLNDAGLGTVLVDLLTPSEAFDRAMVFDVELLAARLRAVAHTVSRQPGCDGLPIGYFGASTGAAAALTAAAGDRSVGAVVSRGGRPDLAAPALPSVDAPTLLIVGSKDTGVLQLNRTAARHLGGEHRIEVVPGATHLFEEPGALEIVAQLAQGWFLEHLGTSATRPLDRRRRT